MRNKNILVTGGAGYIGSHACKALKKAGFNPITYDNLSTGWEDAVQFGVFEKGDLRDSSALEKVFAKYKPIAVMHFAALSLVSDSVVNPGKYWHNNVYGSMCLLEAAKNADCKNIIFSSTCATYGDQDNVILNEDSNQYPINAYGASKRAIEDMLHDFQKAHGIDNVIFRYFNVAGADPEVQVGEFHRPESHLIPLVLETALRETKKLEVYGVDYPTPDGTCIRDYVHVCDLVDAHILGLQWLLDGKRSRVFSLGTGHGFSVLDVLETAEKVTKKEIHFKQLPRRSGDSTRLVSGSDRAKVELGWKPKRSDLHTMVHDAWNWHLCGSYKK